MKWSQKIWIIALGIAVALLILLTTIGIPEQDQTSGDQPKGPAPTSLQQTGKAVLEQVIKSVNSNYSKVAEH